MQAIVVHISDLGAFFVFAPLFVQHHFPLTLEDEVEQPSRISHGRPRARRGKAEGQAPRTRALSAFRQFRLSPGVAATSQHSAVTPSAPGRGRLAGRAAVPGAGTAPPTRPGAHLYLRSHVALSERGPSQGDGRRGQAEGDGRRGGAPAARLATRRRRAPVRLPLRYPRAPVPDRERGTRDGVRPPAYVGSREPQARSRCAVSAERCSGCSHEKRSPGPRPPGDSVISGIAERGADERRAKSRSAGAAPARRCGVPDQTARCGRRGAGRPARRAGPRGARARAARRVGARFPGFADFGFISDLNSLPIGGAAMTATRHSDPLGHTRAARGPWRHAHRSGQSGTL